jgi:hypothetical protein
MTNIDIHRATTVWLGLLVLTLGSAWLGEGALPAGLTAVVVALIVGVKGLLVIRHYMGLTEPGSRCVWPCACTSWWCRC